MLKQPVSIVNYTNVAIIKLKVNKDKFELACYKNKIKQYREKIENDVSNVLQINEIFTNAVKGDKANKKDLAKHFPGMTNEEIIELILLKGDIQVSEKERENELGNMRNDIATIICEKTFDLKTGKPFSLGIILQALKDIGVNIKEHEDAKKQALIFIKQLQTSNALTIERRYMKLGISVKKGSIKHYDVLELLDYLNEIKAVDVKDSDSFDDLIKNFEKMNIEIVEEEKKEKEELEEQEKNKKSKKSKKDTSSKSNIKTECFNFFKSKKTIKLVSPGYYRELMTKFEDSKLNIVYDYYCYLLITRIRS